MSGTSENLFYNDVLWVANGNPKFIVHSTAMRDPLQLDAFPLQPDA